MQEVVGLQEQIDLQCKEVEDRVESRRRKLQKQWCQGVR